MVHGISDCILCDFQLGWTALHHACFHYHLPCVRWLLSVGDSDASKADASITIPSLSAITHPANFYNPLSYLRYLLPGEDSEHKLGYVAQKYLVRQSAVSVLSLLVHTHRRTCQDGDAMLACLVSALRRGALPSQSDVDLVRFSFFLVFFLMHDCVFHCLGPN